MADERFGRAEVHPCPTNLFLKWKTVYFKPNDGDTSSTKTHHLTKAKALKKAEESISSPFIILTKER